MSKNKKSSWLGKIVRSKIVRILLPLLLPALMIGGILFSYRKSVDLGELFYVSAALYSLAGIIIAVSIYHSNNLSRIKEVVVDELAVPVIAAFITMVIYASVSGKSLSKTEGVLGGALDVLIISWGVSLLASAVKIAHICCKQKGWKVCSEPESPKTGSSQE